MIFHIGLHKTGTTSLAKALRLLGYKVSDNNEAHKAVILQNIFNGNDPLKGIEVEAIVDNNAVNQNFEYIYKHYPSGYYINTPRSTSEWLESRTKHVIGNQQNPNYEGNFLEVDINGWISQKANHEKRVEAFSRKANVLDLAICNGEGWDKLCDFLAVDKPNIAFPHLRKT